jgi:hypothetical protein
MFSLEAATVGKDGYRELFQTGEAVDGRPLIDNQHPHDLFMQLAVVWRIPISSSTGFTLAGAPVGEAALGPVAYMHRASAADNPTAPLSHHTFDSTHVSFGVATAAVDHGRFLFEGSVFNGREPDENRWDFDFGRLDSYSGRVWYRGRNDTDYGARSAVFIEGARQADRNTMYGRLQVPQVETALLQTDRIPQGAAADLRNPGVGGDVTFYGVPGALQPIYNAHPVSFHLFVRVRPPQSAMGRMWNMRMSQPMARHQM